MNLPCFVCPIQFDDINKLCKHIQNVHKIRGPNSYQCKLCNKILDTLDTFKRHLERCLKKTRNHQQTNQETNNDTNKSTNESINSGVNLGQFQESIQESALQFALKLSSKMAIPRNFVFEIIEDIKDHILSDINKGIENVFGPLLSKIDEKNVAETFGQICSSAFCNVETEHKLDSNLEKADLISPLRKFPIGAMFKQSEVSEESDVEEDNQQSSDQATFGASQESSTGSDMEAERIIDDVDMSEYDSDSRFDSFDERTAGSELRLVGKTAVETKNF